MTSQGEFLLFSVYRMAASDVWIRFVLWNFVVPVLVMYIMAKLFKQTFRNIYLVCYAFIVNRMSSSVNKKLGKKKQKLFTDMQDMAAEMLTLSSKPGTFNFTVLEIGAGSGANFKYYPTGTDIICVEPNPHFETYLRSHADEFPHVHIKEFIVGCAEDLPLIPSDSVDAVVSTLVLCSVNNINMVLGEIHRVLRPGGKFFFLEHIAADRNTFTYKFQSLLNPAWHIFSDGCSLINETWNNILRAGFKEVKQEKIHVESKSLMGKIQYPFFLRRLLIGVAVK